MSHEHPIYDNDHHFIINPVTRAITNAKLEKAVLIQYDHNSERFTFEMDRYIEDHDMLLCNKVEIHYINLASGSRQENRGVYGVTDLQVSEADSSKVECSWLISDNATLYPGSLSFLIMFACVEDEIVVYRWHTDINSDISIAKGMSNAEIITSPLPDIIEAWKNDIYQINFGYEAAMKYGFEGSESDWVDSLVGPRGYSPTVTFTEENGVITATVVDIEGTKVAQIKGGLGTDDVNELINTAVDGKFADADHTHDDRYYTETEMDAFLAVKTDVVSKYTPEGGEVTLAVADNSEYRFSSAITTLTITYPTGDFECWFIFTAGDTITVTFPEGTKYVGGAPEFEATKTYEISIKDGVVACAEVVTE